MTRVCSYKDCGYTQASVGRSPDSSVTMFRFPKDDEDRYKIWLENCGYADVDEMDLNELRFLCEKHFSTKYIARQSRRRMLIKTAVPIKYGSEEAEGNISATSITLDEADLKGETIDTSGDITHVNIKDLIEVEEDSDQIEIQPSPKEEKKITTVKLFKTKTGNKAETSAKVATPRIVTLRTTKTSPAGSDRKIVGTPKTEKILVHPSDYKNNKRKIEEMYGKVVKVGTACKDNTGKIVYLNAGMTKATTTTIDDNDLLDVSQNVSSTNLEEEKPDKYVIIEETKEKAPASPEKPPTKSSANQKEESFNEFIFNGEMYVQMPKRLFLEKVEKEKKELLQQLERYKNMLKKVQDVVSKFEL